MPRFGKYRGRNLLLLLYRVLQRSLGCQQKAVELSWLLASLALVCIPTSLHVPARMAPNCPDSVANEADVSYVDRNGLAGGWVLELVDNVENCSLLLYLFGVSAEFGLNGCAYPENRWLKLPPGTGLHSKQKSSARLWQPGEKLFPQEQFVWEIELLFLPAEYLQADRDFRKKIYFLKNVRKLHAHSLFPALAALTVLLPRGWAGIRVLPRSERTGITSVTAQR